VQLLAALSTHPTCVSLLSFLNRKKAVLQRRKEHKGKHLNHWKRFWRRFLRKKGGKNWKRYEGARQFKGFRREGLPAWELKKQILGIFERGKTKQDHGEAVALETKAVKPATMAPVLPTDEHMPPPPPPPLYCRPIFYLS